MIKTDNVKHLNVPHYEGLTFLDILGQAEQIPEVMICLPESQKEILKVGKQYLINLVYTIVGQKFADWVLERIELRNQKLVADRGLMIEVDEEVAKAYQASSYVS